MELNTLAQIEAPLGRGHLLPARRKAGLDLEVLRIPHQAFVRVLQEAVRCGVVLRMRIESQDVVLRSPSQRGRETRDW